MLERLVILGATGDLAGRFLLPALGELMAGERLPRNFEMTGAAVERWDEAEFRRHARERLDAHPALPPGAREAIVRRIRYRPVQIDSPASMAGVLEGGGGGPLAAYLALPPALFAVAIRSLGAAGLPPGSRIAVEKPFGEDLDSARALNALLAGVCAAREQGVFRVDHVLGMSTVHNLLGLRLATG